ncbi:uncharacterized protein LOC130963335 [Arachis stenosperma]|uniref:uncharacterized protein LOC130963335 n=1 Tax=Arachis stenosperma TaxID=217475 RepID=UPI0025AC58C2|nr:uncharacterized protein LOC130963335 [Arachis stenosperma]
MDLLKQQRPRKLNLNAPLLSTKRYCFSSPSDNNSLCAGAGVPFSWEQAPGKPKHNDKNDYAEAGDTPRPRLPPPVANVSNDDDDEVYSDAMDVFSLSEALDIVQKKSEKARYNNNSNTNEGLLRLKIQESDGYQSPTYMINRFLPDATALAASSALHFPSNCDEKGCETCSYQECCLSPARSSAVRNDNYNDNAYSYSYSYSPKSCYCGLEVLLPWRVKHKLCSMKSPVLLPPLKKKKAEEHNQRSAAKQKKRRRRSSSSTLTHLPCSCTNSKEDSI